jgi:hypothetical protein
VAAVKAAYDEANREVRAAGVVHMPRHEAITPNR